MTKFTKEDFEQQRSNLLRTANGAPFTKREATLDTALRIAARAVDREKIARFLCMSLAAEIYDETSKQKYGKDADALIAMFEGSE